MEGPPVGDEKLNGEDEKVLAGGGSKMAEHNGGTENVAGRNSPTAVIDLKELTESDLLKKFEVINFIRLE